MRRKSIFEDHAETGFPLLFSNLGSVIVVWFQPFSVGVLNPSNTRLNRDLVYSGVFWCILS